MTTHQERALIDVDEAKRLLDALERDLGRAGGDPAAIATLRTEVNELRALLNAADRSEDAVHSGLQGVRERLHLSDELVGDAVQVGRYLSELGRILGLG